MMVGHDDGVWVVLLWIPLYKWQPIPPSTPLTLGYKSLSAFTAKNAPSK
jgi:hypothetical protein